MDEFGVARSPKGANVVDEHMRTTRVGVYAASDVTGRDQFVDMAAYGVKIAARGFEKEVAKLSAARVEARPVRWLICRIDQAGRV